MTYSCHCLQMIGMRNAVMCRYTVGYSSQGLLQAIKMDYYANSGYTPGDSDGVLSMALTGCDAAYYCPNWLVCPPAHQKKQRKKERRKKKRKIQLT